MVRKAKNKINHFNNIIALKLTDIVQTMWVFYIFVVMCFLPIIFENYQETILYISNCFQLCFLPVLAVGQYLVSKGSERRAQKTYDMVKTELQLMKDDFKIDKELISEINNLKKEIINMKEVFEKTSKIR